MISFEKIREIAQKSQTTTLNIGRDYIQALFLYAFYQQKESADFFFKGGTALHFVYQSPRYSEDLDFSAKTFDCQTFEKSLASSLLFMEKSGLNVNLVESKPTTGGCLAIFSVSLEKLPVKVQVEVSLRTAKDLKGEAVLIKTKLTPAFDILILKEEALVRGKIEALLARKKPRDFYDLYFILRTGLKITLSEKERSLIIKEVKSLSPKEVATQLKELFPRSHRLIIKDLPSVLRRELERKGLTS